jgi:spore protease
MLPYTDLALESTPVKSEKRYSRALSDNIMMTSIDRGKGSRYITYECSFNIISDDAGCKKLSEYLSQSIKKLMGLKRLTARTLIIGLGNRGMTADALGPKVVDKIKINDKINCVYAFNPSVKGLTGLETYDVVKGISDRIKPDMIIAIDTLASRRVNRISSAFQMTDSGISPGSGVGNIRQAINAVTLGIPVIAIGVPLVVYAKTLALDVLGDYLDNASQYDLSEKAVNSIRNSLNYKPSDLVVTPKEIDIIVDAAADIIADAINIAL